MRHLLSFALLLGGASAAQAQDLTNNGATLTLADGAVLSVVGGLSNSSGTLDLSSGANSLYVGGNLVNAPGATLTPGAASTVILNGTAAQQLSLNGAGLANLTVNNTSGGVTLPANSNTDVAGALTLSSGLVTTAPSATLRLLNGATLTGETSTRYVVGNLAAVKANVPAGAATAFPNGFTVTPGTTLTNLTATRTAGLQTAQVSYGTNADGTKMGIDQIWRTSASLTNAQVVLSWLQANDNGLTASLTSAQVWARAAAPAAGSGWDRISATQNGTGRSATGTAPAATSYSFFTVSTASAPLPVVLTSFTAEARGADALLRWATASELRNDYFEVESSADGTTFQRIGRVAGHGTSTQAHSYQLLDPAIARYVASPVYYRLRQVDLDGTASYSPVRAVQVAAAAEFAAAAWPLPFGAAGPSLTLRTATAGPVAVRVYDATGRCVLARTTSLAAGTSTLPLAELGPLATGLYMLHVAQGAQQAQLKLVRE